MNETISRREYSRAGNVINSLLLLVGIVTVILMYLDLQIKMRDMGSEGSKERLSNHSSKREPSQVPPEDRELSREEGATDESSETAGQAPPVPTPLEPSRIEAVEVGPGIGDVVNEVPVSPREVRDEARVKSFRETPDSSHGSAAENLPPEPDTGEDGGVEGADGSIADGPAHRVEATNDKRENRSETLIDRDLVVTHTPWTLRVGADKDPPSTEAEPIEVPEMSMGDHITVVGCLEAELIGSIQPLQVPDASLSMLSGKMFTATVEVNELGEGALIELEGELVTPFLRSRAESAIAQAHWTSPGFGCSAWVTVRFVFP